MQPTLRYKKFQELADEENMLFEEHELRKRSDQRKLMNMIHNDIKKKKYKEVRFPSFDSSCEIH